MFLRWMVFQVKHSKAMISPGVSEAVKHGTRAPTRPQQQV